MAWPSTDARAATTDLLISEYIEGSSFNKALEIYNGTGASIDLAAGLYNIQMHFNGNSSAGLTVNLTGTVADGDVFVIANSSANAAILAQADQTNGAGWFNGDDAVVLRKGTTILDVVGQIGFDPGSQWGTDLTSTADNTLRRNATVCAGDSDGSNAFDPAIEWAGFAEDTVDGLGSHTANCGSAFDEPKINEFSASTTSTDVEYVEIIGNASTDYSTYTVLEIEGDSTSPGVVDQVIALGSTDANGFYLASLAANDLENGTLSLLLVKNFTGALGNDLDSNNDGTFDTTPWDAIVDSVAINDGGAGDLTYGGPALGPNYDGVSNFAPGGASRFPDGADTEAASDWVRNDFDLAGIPGFTGTAVAGEAYNTPGASNEVYVPPADACGFPSIKIHDIQGSGLASALDGTIASIEGIVVGDFQAGIAGTHGNLSGFYVQEEDADADADSNTSEGIFVYQGAATVDVNPGDHVRVTGTVDEYFNRTELTALSFVDVCTAGAGLPMVTEVNLPIQPDSDFEHLEGMYVTFPQALVISEYFNFDRFGEIVLTSERRLTPTAEFLPGSDEALQAAADFLLDKITLDDGRTSQNPDPAIHPNGAIFDLNNLFRGGDTVANVTGVMDYAFNLYRVQPTMGADYTSENPRVALPDEVGGSIKVASFNVLNYFTTLDYPRGDPLDNMCGPSEVLECRGADWDQPSEFTRQRDKIIAALTAIDADVVGLIEIENNLNDDAVIDLVEGLNEENGAGTYDYVSTGTIGTDAIKVALIYQPASVSPVGTYAILDSSVNELFLDTKNRPVLAQSFSENASGGVFTVAVNHLKSKGSDCDDVGDPDVGDGAGNCNLTRAAAAQALADWLATDPTGSGDTDVMIVGDLNSYDKEDPIAILDDAGYTDLAFEFGGEAAYSYVFDGQIGYLDYALASPTLFDQVSGATEWHINADEPDLIDYDTSFKADNQDALYAPDPYRSSDHDPVIAGLDLLHFGFSGFFKPIKNLPEVNSAKAGSSVPVKFSLAGDFGLDILVDGYPQSRDIDCETGEPGDIEATSTAGDSSLMSDANEEQYIYVWQTDKSWSGTCRRLEVILKDGTQRYVNFEFK